jgi:hypothetical protein
VPTQFTRATVRPSFTSIRLWALLISCLLIAAALIGFDVWRRANNMQAARTSVASVASANKGELIKAVLRLDRPIERGLYPAHVLETNNGSDYQVTSTAIRVFVDSDSLVVMGSARDVRAGAILQAEGRFDATHVLRAKRVVVLTGFVRINP